MAHASNTIWLKGKAVVKEGKGAAAITPGQLIYRQTDNLLAIHNVAGAVVLPMFALEADFVGKEISVAYAANDQVQAIIPEKGAEVYALVGANAAALVIGDYVESAGNGYLRKQTPFSQSGTTPFAVIPAGFAVGRVLEALNNSAGGSPARLRIEVV